MSLCNRILIQHQLYLKLLSNHITDCVKCFYDIPQNIKQESDGITD